MSFRYLYSCSRETAWYQKRSVLSKHLQPIKKNKREYRKLLLQYLGPRKKMSSAKLRMHLVRAWCRRLKLTKRFWVDLWPKSKIRFSMPACAPNFDVLND